MKNNPCLSPTPEANARLGISGNFPLPGGYGTRRKLLRAISLILIMILLFLVSCKTTNLPPIGARDKPFQIEEDERKVWQDSERLERILDKKDILHSDPSLELYLNEVAKKLLAGNIGNSPFAPRIRVIRSPYLNAYALPNGAVYIYTGMLARMESESQLATVLGHELAHVIYRHTIKEIRKAKNQELLSLTVSGLLAGAAAAGGGSLALDLSDQVRSIWILASVTGYSRDLETEADTEGLRLMVEADYDPGESVKVFEILQHEIKEYKIKEPSFYGTHPHVQARIESYRNLISTRYSTRTRPTPQPNAAAAFLARMEPVILENAKLDIDSARLKSAQAGIEKLLQRRPDCGRAYFYLGEVYRRSGKDNVSIQKAVSAYQEATRLSPMDPLPYRELGLLYRSQKRREEACAAFEQFLDLNPEAVDAKIIQGYLAELRKP
jgi:predicted Zn-dependent protease